MRYVILLVAAATIAAAPPSSDQFSQAIGAALQADEARALKALSGVDLTGLPERDQAAAACMSERFGPGSKPARPQAIASLADRWPCIGTIGKCHDCIRSAGKPRSSG